MIDLYDESKDTFFTVSWKDLLQNAALDEADRLKFENMDDLPVANNLSFPSCMFEGIEGANSTVDRITVARGPSVNGAPAAQYPPGSTVGRVNEWLKGQKGNTIEDNATGPGLVLITNTMASRTSGNKQDIASGDWIRVGLPGMDTFERKEEYRSFFTASGLFNGTYGNGLRTAQEVEEISIYSYVLQHNTLIDFDLFDPTTTQNLDAVVSQRIFTKLMIGKVELSGQGGVTVNNMPN